MYNKNHWVTTKREFLRWKKTDNFKKWRKKQFLEQGGICYYCQIYLPFTKINVEHKTAISLGGRNNKRNLVLACSSCNTAKSNKVLSDEDRSHYKWLNRNHKGTYLKNKEYHEWLYSGWDEDSLIAKLKEFC